MKSFAIIPARGGSKRIPGKNIRNFLGKPVIAYSIEMALQSGLFSEVMVSTDDKEIAEIAIKYGASVPFMRSAQNSGDHATISDVLKEVLGEYKNRGQEFELFCCIFSTAPLIRIERLKEAYNLCISGNYDSVFPVLNFGYPIQRGLKMSDGKVSMLWPENLNVRSQDLAPAYHDSGQFYWMKTDAFLKKGAVFTDNSGAIVIPESEAQDIDTEEDWKMAELKWKLFNEK